MKLKDIQVGEEYAIIAPMTSTSHGLAQYRVHGRVTRVGVSGVVYGDWSTTTSTGKNYVEFEVLMDARGELSGGRYHHKMVRFEDGREVAAARHSGSGERFDTYRAPSSHFRMTWAENLVELGEDRKREAVEAIRVEQDHKTNRELRERLENLGVIEKDPFAGDHPQRLNWLVKLNRDQIIDLVERIDGALSLLHKSNAMTDFDARYEAEAVLIKEEKS